MEGGKFSSGMSLFSCWLAYRMKELYGKKIAIDFNKSEVKNGAK